MLTTALSLRFKEPGVQGHRNVRQNIKEIMPAVRSYYSMYNISSLCLNTKYCFYINNKIKKKLELSQLYFVFVPMEIQ